jgi:Kef-type K+ transport system membrane component KefB
MDGAPAIGGRRRRLVAYGALWASCCLGIAVAVHVGRNLAPPPRAVDPAAGQAAPQPALGPHAPGAFPWPALLERPAASLCRLVLQLMVILLATRTVGSLFRRFGLPAVVGEITAGVLLGPSMLGWLWPGGFDFIFTGASLVALRLLSQVGVTVFMFAVGMELDLGDLGKRARSAFLVSQTGILVPFLLGTVSALFLYSRYAGPAAGFTSFALFMGIAMSITAFPVLVRILEDRGMAMTPLGVAAITCAAVGDASAWAILALVVAFARAEAMTATLFNLGLLAAFVAFMLLVVRRLLSRWMGARKRAAGMPSPGLVAAALLLMTGSAVVTGTLGIHALFGAFLAGAIMPRHDSFRRHLAVRLENVTRIVLLPLFFAFSGLRTHIGLLSDTTGWLVCVAIVVVATAGKLGSSMVAAKLEGMDWGDAFSFGALMNTRGLMELIALNIGYDLGVLPPPIFAILVLMALVTTFLTGPLLDLGGLLRSRVENGSARADGFPRL